jgi:hypothetical protein
VLNSCDIFVSDCHENESQFSLVPVIYVYQMKAVNVIILDI